MTPQYGSMAISSLDFIGQYIYIYMRTYCLQQAIKRKMGTKDKMQRSSKSKLDLFSQIACKEEEKNDR